MSEQLKIFINQKENETDVFCFQEVRNGYYGNKEKGSNEWTNMFSDIEKMLPNHNGYFSETNSGCDTKSTPIDLPNAI
jgi:hypothetical protein